MTTAEPLRRYSHVSRARKLWICSECKGRIWPGEYYTYEADSGSGQNVKKVCQKCRPAKETNQ